jgi:curli biogenesis system outer membrane secretion channel CsgG
VEDASIPGTTRPETADLLTAKVMETAGSIDRYELVERERLLAVLEELNLGSSQLADQATGLRIGRLVGARLMLFGSYQVVAMQMRVDLRLVEVETGRVRNTAQRVAASGNMAAWLAGAEAATRELLAR